MLKILLKSSIMLFRWDQSLSVKLLLPWAYRYIKKHTVSGDTVSKATPEVSRKRVILSSGDDLGGDFEGLDVEDQALKSRRRRKEELRCTESWLSAVLPIPQTLLTVGSMLLCPSIRIYTLPN